VKNVFDIVGKNIEWSARGSSILDARCFSLLFLLAFQYRHDVYAEWKAIREKKGEGQNDETTNENDDRRHSYDFCT